MSDDPTAVLHTHVRRFNEAVQSHDFTQMIEGFAAQAEMEFEGVPVGPFIGREAIADAYELQPPDDEVRLLGAPRVQARSSNPIMRGRAMVDVRDG